MSAQPIHVFAKWEVKQGHLKTVLNLLPQIVRASTSEKGNLFYKVHQHNADENILLLFEGYKDETALSDHRNSEHFQTIVVGKIIPLLEDRDTIPTTPLTI